MNNNRRFIPGKGFIFFLIIIPGILAFGLIVMLLWNAILPGVVHVTSITYPQALGILVLSKILFGGFNKRHWGGKWRNEMRERFAQMTPEEREQFKASWKERCNNWRSSRNETAASPSE